MSSFDPTENYPDSYPDRLRVKPVRRHLSAQEAGQLMSKLSRAMATVSSAQERWPQEAFEELITQHPWMSKVSVRVQMTASNDEGYGVGYFVLTPRDIPAFVAGASEIGTVTVPILIKNQEMFPFDVFAYKGNFYPITEDRVLRILRLRDMFTEQDVRLPKRDLMGSRKGGFLTARDFKSRAVDSLSKLSHDGAVLDLAVEVLKQATSSDAKARMAAFLQEAKEVQTFDLEEAKRLQFQKHAHAVGVEVKVATDGTRVRTLWSSHPETGRAQFDSWEDVPLAKLSSIVDQDDLHACVARRHHFVSFGEFDKLSEEFRADEERQALEDKVEGLRSKLSSCYDLSRRAKKGQVPATIHAFQPKDPDNPDLKPFSGIVLNIPKGLSEEMCDILMVLSLDGTVKRLSEYSYHALDTKEPASFPEQICYCARGDEHRTVFVWTSEDSAYGVLAGATPFHIGGEQLFPLPEEGSFTAGPTPGLMSPFVDLRDGTAVLYLPENTLVGESYRPPYENEDIPVADSKPMKVSSEEVSVFTAQILPISGGLYRIPVKVSEVVSQSPVLNEVEARATLALLGISQENADALLKVSEPTQFWYRGPEIGHGAQLVSVAQKVVQDRRQKLEKLSKEGARLRADAAELQGYARQFQSSGKVSSDLAELSMTSALSLDFLNADNLHRFVDMIPLFDETLSALCALLVASRLGLDDVPEEPIQGAVRSLDTILKGLRMIQYTLAN